MDCPTQKVTDRFEEAIEFIEKARTGNPKSKILIHCFAGKSRASTFTLAYMIFKMRVTLFDGMDHLKKCRPIAEPNVGFLIQLKAYEGKILGKMSNVPLPFKKKAAKEKKEAEPEVESEIK